MKRLTCRARRGRVVGENKERDEDDSKRFDEGNR